MSTDELERLLAETEGLKNLKVKTYPEGDAGPRDRWIEAESFARVYNAADYVDEADAALIVAAVNALPELLERVRRLEEALKFYADPNRWPNMPNPKNPHYDLEMDAGSRARFALHARAALNQEPGTTEVFQELAKKQEPLGAEFEAAIGDRSTLYET